MRRFSSINAFGVAALALVLAVALWLRLRGLGDASLWVDEAASWVQSKDGLIELLRRTAADNYPPLHNLILYVTMQTLGDGEWTLRLPSAIAGAATVGLVYWVATFTTGRLAGLVAAGFLALSPFHFFYSQEARAYALFAMGAALFAGAGFALARKPTFWRAVAAAVSGLVLVYAHTLGVLYWIAIAGELTAIVLTNERPAQAMRLWIGTNVAIVAGFLPWALVLLLRTVTLARNGFWVPYPTPDAILQTLTVIGGGPWWGVLLLAGAVLALPGWRDRNIRVLWLWAVAPVVFALVLSLATTSIFLHRYFIASLPPFLLLSAWGFISVARPWRVPVAAGVAGLAAVIAWTSADRYVVYRSDWRSAAAEASSAVGDNGCVVASPGWLGWPLTYYGMPACFIPAGEVRDLPPDIGGTRLAFVTDALGNAKQAEVLSALEAKGWRSDQRRTFSTITVVELKADIEDQVAHTNIRGPR